MAVSAIQEANTFLYRYPSALTDLDDPKEIIEGLLREALIYRHSSDSQRERVGKANTKIAYLTEVLMNLVYSKKALTSKSLRVIHQRLVDIDNGKP